MPPGVAIVKNLNLNGMRQLLNLKVKSKLVKLMPLLNLNLANNLVSLAILLSRYSTMAKGKALKVLGIMKVREKQLPLLIML